MVVATPCTAPFMGAAIGYALSRSAFVSFFVFTALALGLAAPYLLLSFNPAWTRLLPRPGAWMEVLKQATAIPIFATVIWLVWLFAQAAGLTALAGLLAAFLLLAIAGWILGRWPAKAIATTAAVIVLILAAALPIFAVRKLGSTRTIPHGSRSRLLWSISIARKGGPYSSTSPQAGA
jgi:thiol:disulfide interchange protein